MAHKIFLSHAHADKPIVEPVALRLEDIFGQEQVFYDSWSIRPGDGIIDQINKGLEAPEFVFFFVSKESLASGMVKLEWQNALYLATKGKTRIIPVRVDGSEMPPALLQSLYIDMHAIGLEAAIFQIVNVIQGNASFTPQHQGFSNLTHTRSSGEDGSVEITIRASHLMEPNPTFSFVMENTKDEIDWKTRNLPATMKAGRFTSSTGEIFDAVMMRPLNVSLMPDLPMKFVFLKKREAAIGDIWIFHQNVENDWVPVPCAQPQTVLS